MENKELTQDVFICWCINFINFPSNKLYGLGKDFLKMIVTDEKGKSKIKITNKTRVRIFRQYEKFNILLVADNKYLVIIEDKASSLSHSQLTSNKNKLINLLYEYGSIGEKGLLQVDGKKDINKVYKRLEELGIKEFDLDNIIEVYKKNSIITTLDEEIHVIKIDTNKILNVVEKYVSVSDIIKDFHEYLKSKTDLIDEKRVKEIINDGKIRIGTKFRYRTMCYNCFNNTNKVYIWIPKLYKHNYWLNTLDESKGIIIEENLVHVIINEKNIPQYRYVFVRKIDETSKEYFEFIGVFKLLKYKNKFKRIWKKIDTDEYVTLDLSKYE